MDLDNKKLLVGAKQKILNGLLLGDRVKCSRIVNDLINTNYFSILDIYEKVLKAALYEVGELWEYNKISVATEHLASAIVESILSELYYTNILKDKNNKVALVSCLENEYHQIGLKMVSDVFELNGWNTHFLGSNTPSKELIEYSSTIKPDLIALSLSIYFHLPQLESLILAIRELPNDIPILVGGQAFRHGGLSILERYKDVIYKPDLSSIELFIKNINYHG